MASTNNLLSNASFESGSSFWQTPAGATFGTNVTNAHSGSGYLELSASANLVVFQVDASNNVKLFPVFPGDSVTLSGWISVLSHAGSASIVADITAETLDKNGNHIAWHRPSSSAFPYTFLSVTFIAEPNAASCRVYCEINGGTGTPGAVDARFDDLKLIVSPGPNQILAIPRGLDWQFHRIPEDSTQKFESASLKRVRAQYAQFPRQKFQLAWNYLKDNAADIPASTSPYTDFQDLYGFWLQMERYQSFLLDLSSITQQASDKTVVDQFLGFANGSLTTFQLVHNLGRGGSEIIQNVDLTSLVVLAGGTFENLLMYSEQIDNAVWTKNQCTISANSDTDPNGGSTADKLTGTGSNGYAQQTFTLPANTATNQQYTFSVWLRAASAVTIDINIYNQALGAVRGSTTCSLTTSWQRFSVTASVATGDTALNCLVGGNTNLITSSSPVVSIWGAQLEPAASMSAYLTTTSMAFSYTLLSDGSIVYSFAPPSGALTASFNFYYRVCFDDSIDAQGFLFQLYKLKTINLVEDRI